LEKPPTRLPFGKLCNLRPINTTTNSIDQSDKNDNDDGWKDDDTTNNNNTYYTKIMRKTPETFSRLRDFSHKYHPQPISYDEIFHELLDFYNKEHDQKYF
jgi:hypothetical protein